ncbi:MAG TPA: heavy-metal-associated domain-containing protein [Rhodanobacteraceae bacterium]
MKILKTTLATFLVVFAFAANAATIEMEVNGLVCAFCAQGIEKKLRAFPATSDVVVSLEERLVAVSTKDGQDIPDAELRSALTNAGYTVVGIRREAEPIEAVRARLKDASH